MAIHIGVDNEGTFTDLAAYDAGTGTARARPLNEVMPRLDQVGIDLGEAVLVRHENEVGEI